MRAQKSRLFLYFFIILLSVAFFLVLFSRNQTKKNGMHSGNESSGKEREIRRTPVVRAIEKVLPSVVNLSTSRIIDRRNSLWYRDLADRFERTANPRPDHGYSIGSGSIIDSSGLIVTSAHVVSQASKILVTLNSGMIYPAITLAEDVENDIALLRIVNAHEQFQVIQGIHPGDMMLGETTIAVGNSYGLNGSISVGVLSGIGRSLIRDNRVIFRDLLQTDTAVYPGNSGGPLINLNGKMLGMNMAVRRDAPGIGFAIPQLRLENTLANWMLPEYLSSLSVGIVPAMKPDGSIYIRSVFPGSPAASASLREGMVIERFQGWRPHGDLLEFLRRLIRVKRGEPLELRIAGQTSPVILSPVGTKQMDGSLLARFRLSLSLEELTPALVKALDYPFERGVVVTDLPATLSALGISRGDLLLKLGQRMIYDLNDVAQVLQDSGSRSGIPACFLRIKKGPDGKMILRESQVLFRPR